MLRRSESKGQVNYADISDQFNLIYEAERGEIPVVAAETEEKTAEASVEQVIPEPEIEVENNDSKDVANSTIGSVS